MKNTVIPSPAPDGTPESRLRALEASVRAIIRNLDALGKPSLEGRNVAFETLRASNLATDVFGRNDPAQITAHTNDWALDLDYSAFFIHSSAAYNLTGIAGGADGRPILLINKGSQNITLKHESANSFAANRFKFSDGNDVVLGAGESAIFRYDSAPDVMRWRYVSTGGGGGGSGVPTSRTITATAPVRIDGGASADLSADRTISVNDATTAAKGAVELATSGENAANVAVQGNDSRINVVTTKGDIYAASGVNTPARRTVGSDGQVLTADSADSTGLSYKWFAGSMGAAVGGNGVDGAVSLGSSTVTVTTSFVLNYTTLDVGTGTLSLEGTFWTHIVYAETITGTGGIVQRGASTFGGNGGGAGATGASGGGSGGAGGRSPTSFWVYAKQVTGSGTIRILPFDGVVGNNATAATVTGNGAQSTSGSLQTSFFGSTDVTWFAGSVGPSTGGQSAGPGGTTSDGGTNDSEVIQVLYDWATWISPKGPNRATTTTLSAGGGRYFYSRTGQGGGAGGRNTGAQGGGGGAGGSALIGRTQSGAARARGGDGGAGGAGGAGSGGGGGGSGSEGGTLYVEAMSIASGWTLSALGGNGGNGGAGHGWGGGGGGGAGGDGGIVIVYTAVATSATISAAGGTGGTGGAAGASGGAPGSNGSNGRAGYTKNFVRQAA